MRAAVPSAQTPCSRRSTTSGRSGHVHETALITCTSSRRQIGQRPGSSAEITSCTGQLQMLSRRIGSSFILQIGHVPARSSTTSGCIGHVQDRGGTGLAGLKACTTNGPVPARRGKATMTTEKITGRSRELTERHYSKGTNLRSRASPRTSAWQTWREASWPGQGQQGFASRPVRSRFAAREMPPWHIDKTVGIQQFKNDRSLSDEQIDTIVRWVDGGSAMGDPKDMPAPRTWPNEQTWTFADQFGPPDLVIKSPPYTMPAHGQDVWFKPVVPTGLTEPRWVRAIEIRPSTVKGRRITHHTLARLRQTESAEI